MVVYGIQLILFCDNGRPKTGNLPLKPAMNYPLGTIDTAILVLYGLLMVAIGFIGSIARAAGIAVMGAYTNSISFIAVPGKAFDKNWDPLIFALTAIPVTWFVAEYVIPHYRKHKIISVYKYLEEKTGDWGRVYASLSFVLFMIGRTAVILYLSSLLLTTFIDVDIRTLILIIGVLTIAYTLMGGMEAVIWTDVLQSIIMIGGLLFSAYLLTMEIFSEPDFLEQMGFDANKSSLGDASFSSDGRTVWVMIMFVITENIRNLMADQNYTQKYSAVATEKKAKKSLWLALLIYLPLTAIFLYIGTALVSYYSGGGHTLDPSIVKGDEVFPYFIANELPVGLKGLILVAILAASMSTVDSALSSSSTVLFLDYKRYCRPNASAKSNIRFLRLTTVLWGFLGIAFALLFIGAESAFDIWWQISGIFGGGILGLFLLALFNFKIKPSQGIISVVFSILIIIWGSILRESPSGFTCMECSLDPIIVGSGAKVGLLSLAPIFVASNKRNKLDK